jgi:hypothetical protein
MPGKQCRLTAKQYVRPFPVKISEVGIPQKIFFLWKMCVCVCFVIPSKIRAYTVQRSDKEGRKKQEWMPNLFYSSESVQVLLTLHLAFFIFICEIVLDTIGPVTQIKSNRFHSETVK